MWTIETNTLCVDVDREKREKKKKKRKQGEDIKESS